MKSVHILRLPEGAAAGDRPAGKLPPGIALRLGDDLTEGLLCRDWLRNAELRSAGCGYAVPPLDARQPLRDLERVREGVASLRAFDEIVVWHGPAHADQLMLAWLIPLLLRLEVSPSIIHLATPRNRLDEDVPPTEADGRELMRGYMMRRELDRPTLELLERLWEALTADTPTPLLELTDEELRRLPHWRQTRHAFLARYPDATGLGFHDRTLLCECSRRWKSVARIIAGAVEYARDLAPLSPRVAWRRLLRMVATDERPGALALRCGGALAPEACELRLTELGAEAVLGTTDVLERIPLCEWIGGVLLRSPDRIWRWTEHGLVRDLPPPSPGECGSAAPEAGRRKLGGGFARRFCRRRGARAA